MNPSQNPFRLNIGFIVRESIGYSRTIEFDFPKVDLPPELSFENFKGHVQIDRTQKGLVLKANFSGEHVAGCVRCLDDFNQKVSTKFTELYAFDKSNTDENELIVPDEGYIDLSPILREYLMIDFPTKPICKPDCQGLCQECGINLNHKDCDCEEINIDPRMAKLKNLLEDSKGEK